jgi:hypothetical protein
MNPVGWQVLEPCPCRVNQGQGQVADDKVIVDRSSSPARESVVLEPQGGIRLPTVPHDVCRRVIPWREWHAADARAENPRTRRVGAWASNLTTIMASTVVRVISSAHRRLLVLMPAPPGIDGVVCIVVDAEASPNGGVRRTFSLSWSLVDEHILDILPHMGGWPAFCPLHRDLELSACCCAARSMSVRNFW